VTSIRWNKKGGWSGDLKEDGDGGNVGDLYARGAEKSLLRLRSCEKKKFNKSLRNGQGNS